MKEDRGGEGSGGEERKRWGWNGTSKKEERIHMWLVRLACQQLENTTSAFPLWCLIHTLTPYYRNMIEKLQIKCFYSLINMTQVMTHVQYCGVLQSRSITH